MRSLLGSLCQVSPKGRSHAITRPCCHFQLQLTAYSSYRKQVLSHLLVFAGCWCQSATSRSIRGSCCSMQEECGLIFGWLVGPDRNWVFPAFRDKSVGARDYRRSPPRRRSPSPRPRFGAPEVLLEILRLSAVQAPLASAFAATSLPASPLQIAIPEAPRCARHSTPSFSRRGSGSRPFQVTGKEVPGEGCSAAPSKGSDVSEAEATALLDTFDCLLTSTVILQELWTLSTPRPDPESQMLFKSLLVVKLRRQLLVAPPAGALAGRCLGTSAKLESQQPTAHASLSVI